MQELGIHPDEEVHFGWVAEYGLQSDVLPKGWTSHTDAASGRVFYANSESGSTSWESPVADSLRAAVEIGRRYLRAPSDALWEEQMQLLWEQHKQQLEAWHGPMTDNEGRNYFINSSTGLSSRQDPRVDTQFHWELEKTLLESLRDTLVVPEPEGLPSFGLSDEDLLARLESDSLFYPPQDTFALDVDRREQQYGGGDVRTPRSATRTRLDLARERTDQAGRVDDCEALGHRAAFKEMTETLNGVDFIVKDEAEAQRLLMKRKLQERRERKRQVEREQHDQKYGEEWLKAVAVMEAQRREEEAQKKALADAEEVRKAELFQQQREEERRQEEERRKEEEERKAAEEERQRVLAEKAAKLEEERRAHEELRQQEAARVEAEQRAEEARKAREELISRLREAVSSRNTEALRSAIAEAETAGLTCELGPLKKALEEELVRRRAAVVKARKAAEKLASDFTSAKEAQDCGGPTLAAQWRAAVRELGRPFDEEQLLNENSSEAAA